MIVSVMSCPHALSPNRRTRGAGPRVYWKGARTCLAAIFALVLPALPGGASAVSGFPTGGSGPSLSGGVCAPPALGSPCATGGLAVAGNSEPLPSLAVGNPVHLATGNKYQLDVDLPPNASAPGLELVRHYNSLSTQAGVLGRNWALSYDTRLQQRQGSWWLLQADGSRRRVAAPEQTPDGWRTRWADGRQFNFDTGGRLTGIRLSPHARVDIERHAPPHAHAGQIHRVIASTGHTLEFHYAVRGVRSLLRAVDTPLGRFEYHHEAPEAVSGHRAPRLISVTRPDGMRRLYHHEASLQSGNPYALTGISLRLPTGKAWRLATWRYDRAGRVLAAHAHGRPGSETQLEYVRPARGSQPGLTRITGAGRAPTEVHFLRRAGEYRLLGRQLDETPHIDYDDAGRLRRLGALLLSRSASGQLLELETGEPGWPGLRLQRDPVSGRYTWFSPATGATTLVSDPSGRPTALHHANGDTMRLFHDIHGRPARLVHENSDGQQVATQLHWHATRLQRIEHPFEIETRLHDDDGRVIERRLQRPALFDAPAVTFRESFQHDAEGRLVRHTLPEGGALHYRWQVDAKGRSRLAALHWEEAQGPVHVVLESRAGQPGYRHGNGLEVVTAAVQGASTDTLVLRRGDQLVWRQRRQVDSRGLILRDIHEVPAFAWWERLEFHHDDASRMVAVRRSDAGAGSQPAANHEWWYAWHADGRLAARHERGAPAPDSSGRLPAPDTVLHAPPRKTTESLTKTRVPLIVRDASGLPRQVGDLTLKYGPQRRLETVSDDYGPLFHARHNAFGHRIARQSLRHAGHSLGSELSLSTVHFLYLENRLVAEARSGGPGEPVRITRRYLHAGWVPVGMIDYPEHGPPQLFAVHADLSGTPRLLTDQRGTVRWLARYSPTGRAIRMAGEIAFPLRFPGQYEDSATGWHDNLLRTYVPDDGHYLEPDPMGPTPGTDTWGYAAQQPWRHADPLGLLLFAFDGTRYSADTRSNAWLLAQAYRDGPAHYHAGPGNSDTLDWDAIVAWRAGQILENQWQALLASLEQQPRGSPVPIDIIGFSRGAALARHFGNRIAAHTHNGVFTLDDPLRGRVSACVDLRFMGLFDSVAQFGVAGSHNHLYDFGVAEMWSWVAHAVALHEHRWTFPLLSADAGGAGNVVEAPFVGAHADIGGGVALLAPEGSRAEAEAGDAPSADSDLAKVALAWMHWQAQAASVDFDDLPVDQQAIRQPVLRDMRSPLARSIQRGDRAVESPAGTLRHTYQDDDPRLGRAAREQTEAFIHRIDEWRRQDTERVGTLDMQAYARWLEDTLGWSP
ncbi:MAG TPA: DUF6531 domain-containing protein [Burkholderiaceae bacterium]|nr:DUF6531 domain-containing protein [Burkholderiaceae bacterium]